MRRIREVIVCEGRYDQNALRQVVEATVVTTGGFQIFHDRPKMELLRRLAAERGLILLLDSDGAGFVIRNHLKGAIPPGQMKQAYIPDVYGKERRKKTPGKEGKLGVEGMPPEVLLEALRRAGATFLGEEETAEGESAAVTRQDLLDLGLIGAGSRARRQETLRRLSLPEHMSTTALLETVNLLMPREEFCRLCAARSDDAAGIQANGLQSAEKSDII